MGELALKELQKSLIFILSLLLLVLYPLPARGAEVDVSLELRGEYDDNVFLREDNEVDDYTMIISPSLSVTRKKAGTTLELQYSSKLIYHDEYPQEDTFSHSLNIIAESNPSRKISAALNVNDTYRFFYIDPSRIDQPVLTEDTAEGNDLRVTPSLRFRIGSTSRTIFGYQYTNTYYEEVSDADKWTDSEGHGGSFSWEQELGSEIVLNLGYSYFTLQFEQPLTEQFVGAKGYDDHQAQTSLRWQPSPQVSGDVRYGYVWREYDTNRKLNYPIWDSTLTFNPTEATELQANYTQTFENDVFGQSYENRQGNLELSQDIGRRFKVTLGGSYQEIEYIEYEVTNETAEVWRGDIGVSAAISGKLSLDLSGNYQDWLYEPQAISQEFYIADGTLTYQPLDWLSFDIRYRYLESVSDTTIYEYTVNRYSVAVTAAF